MGRSAVCPENRQENHDQQDPGQRPFGEGQEAGIATPMLTDVHRTVLELGILRHELPLSAIGKVGSGFPTESRDMNNQSGRTIAKEPPSAIFVYPLPLR